MTTSPRRSVAALVSLLAGAPLLVTLAAAPASAAPAAGAVVINEVESSGGVPGDWVELTNSGPTAVDISGYVVTDDKPTDPTHRFVVPAGTSLAPGAYYVADTDPGFGLGSADTANLFGADGTTLLDSYSWTSHATTTYGRCPDGTGAVTTTTSSTRGAVNDCSVPDAPAPADAWPGGTQVSTVDVADQLGGNVSGLAYEAARDGSPAVLWAVQNGPSTLFRLLWDGTTWTPDTTDGWSAGKTLTYPDGTGQPDSEGVTLVDGVSTDGVYVSTERDNEVSGTSRPEVLRFDVSGTTTTLAATAELDLTADLPAVPANSGLEAITWVPDMVLVAKGFRDATTGAAYDPARYAGHGSGLFFTGLEADGQVRAYALSASTGDATRVATFTSGFPGVMDLEWEPETQLLWAACDDTCDGRTTTLDVDATGAFAVTARYERPADMPNLNNEGFAITPRSECVDGRKPVFYSDDANTGGHALRAGTLRCTALPPVEPPATTDPTDLAVRVDSPLRVTPGTSYTAVVTVRNTGTTPAGRTTASVLTLGAGRITAAPDGAVTGPLVSYSTDGLAAGQSQTFSLTLTAPAGPSFGVTGAVVGSTTPDPSPGNNLAVRPTLTF